MHKKILINGYFLRRKITGIERYAYEITMRLDKISLPGEIAIIVPGNTANVPHFSNIELIRHKKAASSHILWQMLTLQSFLLRNRRYTVLEFGNTCLPFAPGIVCLHDIYCEFFREDFSTFKDKVIRLYNRLQYRFIARLAKKIVTVSEYSRDEISKALSVDPSRISVIYSSADHVKSIKADDGVFKRFPALLETPFYFSLGSLSKRKNLRWILEHAALRPESLFAVSGASLPTVKVRELQQPVPPNVIMLGYLEDGEVKALMQKCKAFILPSYYEGFGLTPLEALAAGAKVIVANAASLPEIYGRTARYIDPFNFDVNLEELLSQPAEPPDEILAKYSFDRAARQVYDLIKGAYENNH
ncbi:MAG: glycosyltransferase family 4 protein [Spirochaetes bacterium]|nr:glycosyltransferase family 4 protein [Spirochaetota bacterium]